MLRASGAPNSLFEEVGPDENLHFLSVPATPAVTESYTPVVITSEQYPDLIPAGQSLETIGVATVLISYNWPKGHPRGDTLAVFADRLFSKFDKLMEPGFHESWHSIDLRQDVPGIERHWSAEEAMQQKTADSSS